MKRFLRPFTALALTAAALLSNSAKAQLIGSETFLQGDFVEVGIAQNGAFGTEGDAPSGYHPRGVGLKLGFVSDPGKDGWTVGSPNYIGDYFLPGSPQEGWDMQYNGTWAQAWRGSGGTSMTGGLTGTMTTYTSVAGVTEGTWEGTFGPMKIKAVTRLKKDKLYFTTTVKIKNTTASTIYNIYYDRTVDPDQEVPTPGGGSFTTDNKIIYALPSPGNKTLVTGIGVSAIKAYLGLASRDCRARPYITTSGLTPTDSLSKLHSGNGTASAVLKVDSLVTQDCGIGIVFKIDSLRAGDSTQLSYAYVLSTADVDSAFEELKPELNIGGIIRSSGDTVKACTGQDVKIDIVGGDFYQWKWSPKIGLSDTVGSRITITAGTAPVTYTATAISTLCPIDPITVTIDPIANPDKPKVVTPIYYCQFEAAKPLTATLSGGSTLLRFYTAATGGTALASLTPSTLAAGSKYYYVSQVSSGLCESERERIEVITRPIPVISGFTSTNPTYCGASDGTITFSADSANTTYTLTYDKDGSPATPLTITTDSKKMFTLSGLGWGSYTAFIIVNKYGCKSAPYYGPIELVDPAPPGPPITNNGPLCVDRTAVLNAPLIAGATYTWTGPDGFTSTDRNPTFTTTAKSGGTYTLRVKVGPCVYQPSTTTLLIAPTPKHQQFSPLYEICERSKLVVNIMKEAETNYEWRGPDLVQLDQALTIEEIQLKQSGTYILTATSEYGCVTMDTISVLVGKRPSFMLSPDTTICSIDSANLRIVSDAQTAAWSPVNGLSDSTAFIIKARPQATTTYTAIARSGNICPDTSGKVKVTVIQAPYVSGYDTLVRMNIPYKIMPSYSQDVVRWQWVPSDSLSCSDCPNPTFNSSIDTRYLVYVSDKLGCTNVDTVMIRVFCDGANITMPNAFTPNADGTNDVFYVRGTGFSVKTFRIYNRLGQLVFGADNFMPNDPSFGWDGTFNGQPISDAAGFVYMLEAICFNSKNEPILIKGNVLMIK